ncbi:hypothetical protein G3I32_17545 [Streptomyces coelicoflavus]|uniref:Uncharacterized protein n=1 Tax=Streptomyces coelicoflavus TaxID=285562 RepID=A0A7K3PKZ1_9ACTN|nr:hypothetical protein [Streptomyces coelicoflavus]NEB10628.1 hypothetical protein [Streptomyces coelicoflavus]
MKTPTLTVLALPTPPAVRAPKLLRLHTVSFEDPIEWVQVIWLANLPLRQGDRIRGRIG